MTNEEIISKLLSSDLTVPDNLQMLLDMAKNTDNVPLALRAREYASALARKGDNAAYGIVHDTYRWLAPRDFDSYLIALEWYRRPEEQFYLPRRRQLRTIVKGMQDLADDQLDELFLSMPPRVGKALANDTPILTRNGWKKHGDLVAGDEVIGMDGKFKRVLAVHPKCMLDCKVEITNGETFICHENHEWLVHDRSRCANQDHLIETKMLEKRKLEEGKPGHRGHRYTLQLPFHEYVEGEEKELPLDPYTFGVWLGDGTNRQPRINTPESDLSIVVRIIQNGYRAQWGTIHKTTGVFSVGFGFRKNLQEMGMCYSHRTVQKHIPEVYLTASVRQRLELLAGLLDTDGTFMPSVNRYHFSTVDETLRDGFIALISTFGWRASVKADEPKISSSGIVGRRTVYTIGFNPDCEIPCELVRKRNAEFSKKRALAIKSITRTDPVEGNCITVEGGMYLAGRTLIPTHNTSLLMFYITWQLGRDSEKANLYCAYSDTITNAFYNGVLEIINDPATYDWHNIFPRSQIVATNSKDETLNVDRKKRYASLTCRSLYGTLNGAVDANGILISDDLLSGIEEALSPDRLNTAWGKVDNNMLTRAKLGCKILWCGTRWSLKDPIGIRIDTLENNEKFRGRRYRVINTPALSEKDESNFNYLYGVGFSSDYYRQRRASFEANNDMASWLAQYQGEPIEREGTVFLPDGMRYFNGVLPDGDPDRIFMAVDPAWGSSDYVAGPVIAKYGNDLYVIDVIYDDRDKSITRPRIVQKVIEHNVAALQIEATKMTKDYADGVEELLREKHRTINLTTRTASSYGVVGKEQRIFDKAPEIREKMVFLEQGKRSKEYDLFMQNVFSFKLVGRNKHDDAPDSLCMAIVMDETTTYRPKIIPRLW